MNHKIFILFPSRNGWFKLKGKIDEILAQIYLHKPEGFAESSKRKEPEGFARKIDSAHALSKETANAACKQRLRLDLSEI